MTQADRITQAVIMAIYAGGVVILVQYLFFGTYDRKNRKRK